MHPVHKRRKYNNPQKRKFDTEEDERQYEQIVHTLKEIFNDYIPHEILCEVGEYSTGNVINCNGELNGDCDGEIHYLNGDNFNNMSNAWNLFKYECDNTECAKVSHLLKCADCDVIVQIDEDSSPYPNFICQNALSLNPTCINVYCVNHWKSNGSICDACSVYYCLDCEKESGTHCLNCDEYWCRKHEDESLNCTDYCEQCVFSSGMLPTNINDADFFGDLNNCKTTKKLIIIHIIFFVM